MDVTAFESEIYSVLGAAVHVRDTGIIQRFSTNGKSSDLAGWLVYFGTAGVFGNWRSGEQFMWSSDKTKLSAAERRELKYQVRKAQQVAMQERYRKQRKARAVAVSTWSKSDPVTQHPYLELKGVQAHGIRQQGSYLMVPMIDETGGLWSLQRIGEGGDKKFMPGGRVKGRFHKIKGGERVGIAEGYSTAATIFEQTGDTMFIAFNAGNLEAVAVTARALHPDAHLTIWGDNDQFSEKNIGVEKAQLAGLVSCANEIKIPEFSDLTNKPTDWNDWYREVSRG